MKNKEKGLFDSLFSELTPADIMAGNLRAQISRQIRRKRVELNMSQSEFAEFMNVSQGMVSKWESCSYNFSTDKIAEIFSKLNLKASFSIMERIEEYNRPQNYIWCGNNDYSYNDATSYATYSNISLQKGA